ncbi:MAG: AIR synthase [Cyanobacteria bacterium K_DeepCast_35m_m2_023]|nr:AIR synthase [Cyanobacteria bacterium K_DeepCast_35m_m2_023]
MTRGQNLHLSAAAAAELGRQAAVAGTPGLMHLDLIEGGCERWAIRLRPGHLAGVPLARADGVTVYAPADQIEHLHGFALDYRGDLSGGSFVIRPPDGWTSCACGAAFGPQNRLGTSTR